MTAAVAALARKRWYSASNRSRSSRARSIPQPPRRRRAPRSPPHRRRTRRKPERETVQARRCLAMCSRERTSASVMTSPMCVSTRAHPQRDWRRSLGAKALTQGTHIYFGQGQFAPGTAAGDRLLIHELTHVVQHDQGRTPRATSDEQQVADPDGSAEREASAAEQAVEPGVSPTTTPSHDRSPGSEPPAHAQNRSPSSPPSRRRDPSRPTSGRRGR